MFSEVDHINSKLNTEGTFAITVGAYSNPDKKIMEMKSLGFSKTIADSIDDHRGLSRVLIGALQDLSAAQQVSEILFHMGIKNDILTLD